MALSSRQRRSTLPTHPAPGTVATAAQRALLNDDTGTSSKAHRDNANAVTSTFAAAATSKRAVFTAAAASADYNDNDNDNDNYNDNDNDEDDAGSPASSAFPSAAPVSPNSSDPQHPTQQQAANAAAPPPPDKRCSTGDGMRREWEFALEFVHAAAQVLVACSPQWEFDFIDADCTAYGLAQRIPLPGEPTPMLAALSYIDRTAATGGVSMATPQAMVVASGGDDDGRGANVVTGSSDGSSNSHLRAAAGLAEPARTGGGGDWWMEKSKHVELFYCHPPPAMTLEDFCKLAVKFILRDTRVVSVDGDTHLSRLRLGDKLRCPHFLGGYPQHRSFHLRYMLRDRTELQESYAYVLGSLIGQRGYLLRVRCNSADELERYVDSMLLPTYAVPGRAEFGVDVTYHNVPPTTLLADQQEAFGELQYVDHKAAIVFVTPVYPMKIRPDYSPGKTVGVGSITCMTLELGVHERLLDGVVAAEVAGLAKYKVVPVIICVEVEEVSRMGYPKVMSTEHYSELKAARVADVFPDAKMVGLPTSLYMGNRTGRARTMTFTYEPLRCVVKALVTCTLIGNFGVTALYLTKLNGGLFDGHLYVLQQLLSSMEYLPQNTSARHTRVSRYRVQNIRLGEEDLIRAYRCTAKAAVTGIVIPAVASPRQSPLSTIPPSQQQVDGTSSSEASGLLPPHPDTFTATDPHVVTTARERHLHMLMLGNDGRVEGGVAAPVPLEEGGLPDRRAPAHTSVAGAAGGTPPRSSQLSATSSPAGRRAEARGESAGTRLASSSTFSRSLTTVVSMASGGYVAAAAGIDDAAKRAAAGYGRGSLHNSVEEGETKAGEGEGPAVGLGWQDWASSAHSGSRISISGLSHLEGSVSDSVEDSIRSSGRGSHTGEEKPEHPRLGHTEALMEGEGLREADESARDMGHSVTSQDQLSTLAGGSRHPSSARPDRRPSGASVLAERSQRSLIASTLTGRGDTVDNDEAQSNTDSSRLLTQDSRPSSAAGTRVAGGDPHRKSFETLAARPSLSEDSLTATLGGGGGKEGKPTKRPGVTAEALDTLSDQKAVVALSGPWAGSHVNKDLSRRQQELYDEYLGKGDPTVEQALQGNGAAAQAAAGGGGAFLFGPSLRDVYARCCEAQQCRPNSYLLQKLPAQPEFTYSVEELDLSSNYVGHNGFVAVLHLLEHLPRLRVVYFNNMTLDNVDVESLCYVLAANPTVRELHLKNNTGISLPAMRHFTALLRVNKRIEVLALDGTRLSPNLIAKLRDEANHNAQQ